MCMLTLISSYDLFTLHKQDILLKAYSLQYNTLHIQIFVCVKSAMYSVVNNIILIFLILILQFLYETSVHRNQSEGVGVQNHLFLDVIFRGSVIVT